MSFSLTLPSRDGEEGKIEEIITESNSLVIVGANGSGKSRLGDWIERNYPEGTTKVHRIAAQRSLTLPHVINPLPPDEAEYSLLLGIPLSEARDLLRKLHTANFLMIKTTNRWENKPTFGLLNDVSSALALLFAREIERNNRYVSKAKSFDTQNFERPELSAPDELTLIWRKIFPHRDLQFNLESGDIQTTFLVDGNQISYSAMEMSDGERVALYLLATCLSILEAKVIVIDEPEIHLHKSILGALWNEIEIARPNHLFVYLTHDLEFAASRITAKKIIIQEYDGHIWKWDEVSSIDELPTDVLLKILGSRRPIALVEGEKGNLDYALYQNIYEKYVIIPRGGSAKVIEGVRAFQNLQSLHHVSVCGVIDGDYRSQEEREILENDGIFCLKVAEIENLLCIREVVECVAKRMELDPIKTFEQVTEAIFTFVKTQIENQALRRTQAVVEYHLAKNLGGKYQTFEQFEAVLQKLPSSLDVKATYADGLEKFRHALESRNYEEILRIYNHKGLVSEVARVLNLKSEEYKSFILRLLQSDDRDDIVAGLKKYTPALST